MYGDGRSFPSIMQLHDSRLNTHPLHLVGLAGGNTNPEIKRTCPTCHHTWKDKYRMPSCPKCFASVLVPKEDRQDTGAVSPRPPEKTPYPHRISVDQWLGIPRQAADVSYSKPLHKRDPIHQEMIGSSRGSSPMGDPKKGYIEFVQGRPPQQSAIPHTRYPSFGPRPVSKEWTKRKTMSRQNSDATSPRLVGGISPRSPDAAFVRPPSPVKAGFRGPKVDAPPWSSQSHRKALPSIEDRIRDTLSTPQSRYERMLPIASRTT